MQKAEHFSKPSRVDRILIIQLGDIGDVVLATPTVRAVKEAYPHALVSIMVRKPCGSLLAADPNLHDIVEVTKFRGSAFHIMKENVKFARRLRGVRYDLVIDLRTDDRGAIMSFLTGARERVGRRCAKPFWHDLAFTRILDDPAAAPPPVHPGADQSLRVVRAIGMDTKDSTPKLHISSNDRQYAKRRLAEHGLLPNGRWFTLNPFSRWKYKEWSDDKWGQVINNLWGRFNMPALLIGSPQEHSAAESIVSRCNGGAHNLTGGSIGEMAAVIATSSLHIGVDSAAPHIAAALGVPTVTIHGPLDWRAWRVNDAMNKIITPQMECVPCNRKGCDGSGNGKSQCMERLEANDVLHEIDRFLSSLKEIH